MPTADENKAIVLEGLDALFNRRDFNRAADLWSTEYIQHSRIVPAGRDGLFHLARNQPESAKYEYGLAVAEGDYVIVHGRYSGLDGPALIAADIFRVQNGVMIEHWDVLQEEASQAEASGGHPMFGERFG